MIPLRAARKIEHTPYITYGLIALNVVVFLWQLTLSPQALFDVFYTAGFVPCQVSANLLAPQSFISAFTSMFLHGGWLHLIFNMLFLMAFGPAVEDYLGKPLFLFFYLAAGLAGSAMHMLFNLGICIPAIGASGAITGVMGGFMLLYPGTRVSTVLLFFRVPVGIRDIPALYLLGGYFFFQLIDGLMSIGPLTASTNGVAVWAHIGGFLVGFLMAFFMMTFKPLPPVDPVYLDND